MKRQQIPPNSPEIHVGPHGARPGWAVLRITYRRVPADEARIGRILDFLLAPTEAVTPTDGQIARQNAITGNSSHEAR